MKIIFKILMVMFLTSGTMYAQTTDQPPPVPSDEQPEVLTRGPVNEAFAQPVDLEKSSGLVVPKAPPPDVDETPPAERPAGDQYAWVPGYWAWDTDRNEHIWVSGCWRAVPPGKYWVPGYWAKVEGGWRWVAGFWAPVSEKEINYLPPPPAVTYVEPPDSENGNMIWVPPCWYWSHGRYTLRAGYWIPAREDWVWVPSHYVWTPRGYVFIGGHWDYPLHHRGVLFAPVYFPGNIYTRVRFSYSLSIVVDMANLEFGLFTRPVYSHYYFGDYYDNFYIGIGIFPWFECVTRNTWYDPIYLHDRWRHRKTHPNWWQYERREYERRRADRNLRPPRTYREMEHRMSRMPEHERRNFALAAPIKRYAAKKPAAFKFRQNKPEARRQISRQSEDVRRYVRERSQWESPQNIRRAVPGEREDRRREERNEAMRQREQENNANTRSNERREIRRPGEQENRTGIGSPERRAYPRQESTQSNDESTRRRESSISSWNNRRPSNDSDRERAQVREDNVQVRKSPVADKQRRGIFGRRSPSQPKEEREGRDNRR